MKKSLKTEETIKSGRSFRSPPANRFFSVQMTDDDISSNSSQSSVSDYSSNESDYETPATKRIRIAKEYLSKVKTEEQENFLEIDAKQADLDIIADRLAKETKQTKTTKSFIFIALKQKNENLKILANKKKAHELTVTCLTISNDFIFTASKGNSIIQWNHNLEKVHTFKGTEKTVKVKSDTKTTGHSDQIFALAVTEDQKYLASGGKDKQIIIWDLEQKTKLKTFKIHRDAVTGLVFRKGELDQLYSSSLDRTVAVFDMNSMGYIETLYGHQEAAMAIDALTKERCLTVGQRDRTARIFKVLEDSQLVFKIPETCYGSLEFTKFLDENSFVVGSDQGELFYFNCNKKKPLFIQNFKKQIFSLAVFPMSDLIAIGFQNEIILCQVDLENNQFVPVSNISVLGFVNCLDFGQEILVAGVSKEPKFGRWAVDKQSKNEIIVYSLNK